MNDGSRDRVSRCVSSTGCQGEVLPGTHEAGLFDHEEARDRSSGGTCDAQGGSCDTQERACVLDGRVDVARAGDERWLEESVIDVSLCRGTIRPLFII